jgi:hypothetical protein
MLYNGKLLDWYRFGKFRASSGLSFQVEEEILHNVLGQAGPPLDPQFARFQTRPNEGPIPEGLYSFPLMLGGEATAFVNAAGNVELDKRQGIESLPDFWTFPSGDYVENRAWGPDRVRLSIEHIDQKEARKRPGGYYLHDSAKGFSHGCIEVERAFFLRLRALVQSGRKGRLYLKVKYPSRDASTRAD